MTVMSTTATRVIERKNVEDMYLKAELDVMEKLENEVKEYRPPVTIVWRNVVIFAILHALGLYGGYLFIFHATWQTCFWAFFLHLFGAFGVGAGAHRLWSHRSYKASTPARIYFMLWQTVAFQNDVIEWSRDHRCHHKWTDTEADPHNSKRGFFFSHVGWLMSRKSPKIKEMGSKIDLSDLFADPVLVFQRKHYYPLVLLLCFVLPTIIPVYFWNESPSTSFFVAAIFRYVFTLNITWLINSAAHMFGYKPYDATISPVDSVWLNLQVGEGGHNFHHSFPQDYRASEFSLMTNWTRAKLDAMAYLGLIYDRKTVSVESIERLKRNKGGDTFHWHN